MMMGKQLFNKYFGTLTSRQRKLFMGLLLAGVLFFLLFVFVFQVGLFSSVVICTIYEIYIILYYFITKPPRTGQKSTFREWIDALVFAVIAATIIRAFVIEAYTIPTSSMERNLLVGDFLFVSKVHYGTRLPMTPIAFPFAHHTLPLLQIKSYTEFLQLPYHRLPGFMDIKRNDIVVFNYPVEDFRPVDKRENYIKRCIALPGDTLAIKKQRVHINGTPSERPNNLQFSYIIKTDGTPLNPHTLESMHIKEGGPMSGKNNYLYHTTPENARRLKQFKNVITVRPFLQPKKRASRKRGLFPEGSAYNSWTLDNYGPLYIPKEGDTVQLTTKNISKYKRIIHIYEGHKLKVENDTIYIDGEKSGHYVFDMDYYFMMGDNRHNSLDSRYWGFVPENHIVGKAWFIWMSWDNNDEFLSKIRWNRLFQPIH